MENKKRPAANLRGFGRRGIIRVTVFLRPLLFFFYINIKMRGGGYFDPVGLSGGSSKCKMEFPCNKVGIQRMKVTRTDNSRGKFYASRYMPCTFLSLLLGLPSRLAVAHCHCLPPTTSLTAGDFLSIKPVDANAANAPQFVPSLTLSVEASAQQRMWLSLVSEALEVAFLFLFGRGITLAVGVDVIFLFF
jgi:hypothetical protein